MKTPTRPHFANLRLIARLALLVLALPLLRAEQTESHPFLWVVESDPPSYLFGTIHSSDPAVGTLPDSVTSALAKARMFLPEIDLSPETMAQALSTMMEENAQPLSDVLPPELWEELAAAGREQGVPEFLLDRLQPAVAAFMFVAPQDENFFQSIDFRLFQKAVEHRIRIFPLETIAEQLDVLKRVIGDDAVTFLREVLEERRKGYPNYRATVEAYASGDADRILRLLEEQGEGELGERFLEAVLYERNVTMARRLQRELSQEGGLFVAVGVGHLVGDRGLVEKLRAGGYTVTRAAATAEIGP
ncbi:MAG: TraB/GumN family protein [Puniceicoccaceae bacterium]|nr:MAG: TraB/GumN family protein [Puniceicoccaceae bacterium]